MHSLSVEEINFFLFNILNCLMVITSGQMYPDSLNLPGYKEYGLPMIIAITHSAGKNLQLSCTSENLFQFNKNQDYYISWEFKSCGGKSIVPCQTAVKSPGIAICSKEIALPCRKKLTIHKPTPSNSGLYSCHIHRRGAHGYNSIISMYQVEFIVKERDPPKFVGNEPKNKSTIVSHQVFFECRASSPFLPTSIRWLRRIEDASINAVDSNQSNTSIISYKNFTYYVIQGNRMRDTYYIKEVGPLENDIYLSKLIIRKAEPHHSGHYACVAINSAGIIYREIYLTILPISAVKGVQRRAPELIGDKPKNVSIAVPCTAVLECHAHSFLPPVVRWVRRVNDISFYEINHLSSIEYINNSYQLLNWNDSGPNRYYTDDDGPLKNNIYISKLIFPVTSVFDTGFYACVVMNDLGIIHREVFLNVVPVLIRDDSHTRMSLMILISIPMVIMLITLLVCYQKWRHHKTHHLHNNQNYTRSQVYLKNCSNTLLYPIEINKTNTIH